MTSCTNMHGLNEIAFNSKAKWKEMLLTILSCALEVFKFIVKYGRLWFVSNKRETHSSVMQ